MPPGRAERHRSAALYARRHLQSFGANAFFDAFKLRGFDAPRYLDGLRLPKDITTFAIPRIETYGLERLEVLKGPSSGLYGQSDPGGLINMVSKRPTATPQYESSGTFGSFERFQGAFDIGGPIDKNGEFLYRIVGLARDSNTPDRLRPGQQAVHCTELHLAADDRHHLHDPLAVSEDRQQGLSAIRSGTGLVPAESERPYPLQPLYRRTGPDGFKLEQFAIGYAFEHRFDNNLQFRQNFRYTDVEQRPASIRPEGMVSDRLVGPHLQLCQGAAPRISRSTTSCRRIS